MTQLDLRSDRPYVAAKKLFAFLCERARDMGQDPGVEVFLQKPEEADKLGFGKAWRVAWPGGPYEWGVCLSMGGSINDVDVPGLSSPEVLVNEAKHFYTESYYSSDVSFFPKEAT